MEYLNAQNRLINPGSIRQSPNLSRMAADATNVTKVFVTLTLNVAVVALALVAIKTTIEENGKVTPRPLMQPYPMNQVLDFIMVNGA